MKKLLLIDGMAAVYRAYYALNRNPRVNSKGFNTSAVLGFTTTMLDLIKNQHPTHVAVAFDVQKPTFRHELFAEYKANRDAMPEEIQQGLPYVKEIISAFNIPILTCEGFEADDVIGTIAHAAENAGFDEVLMATPDKDFGQLVTNCVHIYRFGRMGRPDEIYRVQDVLERFGVNKCTQVIDLLGLWGDASDNIPGIPGVGEKTAKKLIDKFGSIENMVEHADDIANEKIRNLVKSNAQQALFSKQLATIVLDVPVSFDESELLLKEPDYEKVRELFEFLEFRALAKRVLPSAMWQMPTNSSEVNQIQLNNTERQVGRQKPIDPNQTSLFGEPLPETQVQKEQEATFVELDSLPQPTDIAFFFIGSDFVLSTSADDAYSAKIGDVDLLALKALMENPDTTKIVFDIKCTKYLLKELDIQISGSVFDVQMAHYLVDPEARHSLEFICSAYLGYEPQNLAMTGAALWQVYPLLSAALRDAGLQEIYDKIELPLVDVLMDMEQEGVRIDVEALRNYSRQLSVERDGIEQEIYTLAGSSFNISSPKQLGEVLYEKLRITDKPARTATKQYSTAEDTLLKLRDKHPIVEKILEYRSLNKLISTYLDSFPKLISPVTGRLHTVYNQTVTATGRLSSSNPNLQNIPIRTQRGKEIRRAFVPRDSGHILMAADYSQIELRIIAALANDRHMKEAFKNHYDIHAATAAKIYKIPIEEVTPDQRRSAKAVNFGIVYGISAFGLSEQLGIPRKEAASLIEEYFQQYPDINKFIQDSIECARKVGYAVTLLGRRRYLSDINSRNAAARSFAERNAVNMPIQGTSADMIKMAMINIYNRFQQQGLQSKMILQVHDELVFDVALSEQQTVKSIVEEEMRNALPLNDLPIDVGIDFGANWLDAH